MDKKIKEINAAGGAGAAVQGAGGSFQVTRRGKIFPIDKKRGKTNGRPHAKKGAEGKLAMVAETEKALRETLRKIIFLNKVKFYEEKARVALQENKLRKIIRYLLKEEDDPIKANLSSTGQANAHETIGANITNLKNGYMKLITSKAQRDGYIETIYNGVVKYFDLLKKVALGQNVMPTEQPELKSDVKPPSPVAAPEETGPEAPEQAPEEPPEELAEQEGEAAAPAPVSPEELKQKEKEDKAERERLAKYTVSNLQDPQTAVDPTGADEALKVLVTVLPTFAADFAACKTDKDKQDFIDFLVGPNNDKEQSWLMSTMKSFEQELNASNPKTREG